MHPHLQDVIVEKVKMLLGHGADVNKVAGGHSPLSLAIIRGYDQVCVCVCVCVYVQCISILTI